MTSKVTSPVPVVVVTSVESARSTKATGKDDSDLVVGMETESVDVAKEGSQPDNDDVVVDLKTETLVAVTESPETRSSKTTLKVGTPTKIENVSTVELTTVGVADNMKIDDDDEGDDDDDIYIDPGVKLLFDVSTTTVATVTTGIVDEDSEPEGEDEIEGSGSGSGSGMSPLTSELKAQDTAMKATTTTEKPTTTTTAKSGFLDAFGWPWNDQPADDDNAAMINESRPETLSKFIVK